MLLLLLLSHFSRVRLFMIPWTAAYQAPPSMGFSRQEYGILSRLPPKPRNSLPHLVIYGVTSRGLPAVLSFVKRVHCTPGSMIPQKDSQNSNKATMLTVTAYYRERIQTEISKEQRQAGRSWRESRHRLLVGLSRCCCVDRAASAQQGSVTTHKRVNNQESPWCLGVGGYPGGLSCRHGAHTWLTWTAQYPGPPGPNWYPLTQGPLPRIPLSGLAQGPE